MPVVREKFTEPLAVRVSSVQFAQLKRLAACREAAGPGRFPVSRAVREALADWIKKEGWRALPGEAGR